MDTVRSPSRVAGAGAAHSASLQDRYDLYRKTQGRELLNVIPREGVRTLLRHFREDGGPTPDSPPGENVLEWLAERCCDVLPLPPFEVWAEEFHAARRSFSSVPGPPLAPEAPDGAPVTVDVRPLLHRGQEWIAALALRADEHQWLGHIRFHAAGQARVYTTGDVFREPSPMEVRKRFRAFDERTLSAFLRSALP